MERLNSYNDLLLLAERLSLLNDDILMALQKLSNDHRDEAQHVLITAREARQVIFKIFTALAHKQPEKLDKNKL